MNIQTGPFFDIDDILFVFFFVNKKEYAISIWFILEKVRKTFFKRSISN